MDILGDFITVRCTVHPNASAGATPLYNAYKDCCEENGETAVPQRRFGLQLGERCFEKDKIGTVVWHSIGLSHDKDDGCRPYRRQGPEVEPAKISHKVASPAMRLDLVDHKMASTLDFSFTSRLC